MGGGGGAGKVSMQDMTITKYVDKGSPGLQQHVANGKHIDTGELVVRKAGGKKPLEYIKYKLTDLIVTSYQTGGSGGEDRLTENISLNFAKIEWTYTPQKDDGSGEPEVKAGWDIKKNESTV